jgi:hypothetical protein
MDNFFQLQLNIQAYIEEKLSKHYDFNLWKETLVHCRTNQLDQAVKRWGFFNDDFSAFNFIVDVIASEDEWAPTLHIDFMWNFGESAMQIRAMVVKDKVLYAQIVNMMEVHDQFGDNYDFSDEFNKMKIMETLRK